MTPNRKPSERVKTAHQRAGGFANLKSWDATRSVMSAAYTPGKLPHSAMRDWLRVAYLAGWRARARAEKKGRKDSRCLKKRDAKRKERN